MDTFSAFNISSCHALFSFLITQNPFVQNHICPSIFNFVPRTSQILYFSISFYCYLELLRTENFFFIVFLIFSDIFYLFVRLLLGLVEKVKHKELMRRVHLLHPSILPADVLQHIRPDSDEMSGALGTVSKPCRWDISDTTASSIVFNVHISSDGVTPYKTEASSVRCIMGRIDSLYSPSLSITVPIPDAPPFLIGIYKGKLKKGDGALEGVVKELELLSPDCVQEGRAVYCQATAWIADAVEKSAVMGIVSTAGTVGCPRCEQPGKTQVSKWQESNLDQKQREKAHNHVYFPNVRGFLSRENHKWSKYTDQLGSEVSHIIFYFLKAQLKNTHFNDYGI